ncbi:HAD-superfamily hydrolase, subfamily IIA [Halorubrum aidingense JCM 13560]|uniref:HAD-superfamily hydrolase, subfamily IIA n=1 Tax=Halorubrum aidingense JCM 13560 TaxID=1230454 RepID=M0PE33_9EURY|nr:HAD-IIA family hydrolase [Halorubrum aidingense]EMA67809.1 HAD-superfamily hydrolase, subfamily IIA [Halorubrum aidingense JCM 13560]
MGFSGAVLDVDGTVVRGDEPIPGAPAGYRRLREAGIETLFVSNNPTKAPPAYVDRLGAAGYEVDAEQVFTAGTVTTRYLCDHHADDELLCIGAPGLFDQFAAAGLATTDDVDTADALVASIDHEFDYDDLCTALWTLDRDVPFIGTDPDVVIPAPGRDVPGSGAVINAIAGVAERDPDVVLGKPSDPAIEMVRERLPYPPEECLVVGDRLNTDIALGERAGMTTVLVRSGVTDDETLAAADVSPDHVLDDLGQIGRVID